LVFKPGRDKPTKVPVNPHTGALASVTDLTTWDTFDGAVSYAERNELPGVGFVFSSGDPYAGVDLDNAVNPDGSLKAWAAAIVAELDSYTEYSQSGTGVHVIVKGKVPGLRGRRSKYEDGEVEVYSVERFFVVTGKVVGDSHA
jgi:primase-polymerase (primpol)-like protein